MTQTTVMHHYAGIGTRNPTDTQRQVCYLAGRWLARRNHCLHTGAAKGADQAFAEGATTAPAGSAVLHLPWKGFERAWLEDLKTRLDYTQKAFLDVLAQPRQDAEARELVKLLHPAWEKLGNAFPLMARNVRIIKPDEPVDFVVAARSRDGEQYGTGGTEFGIRLAQHLGVPLVLVPRDGDVTTIWANMKTQIRFLEEPEETT